MLCYVIELEACSVGLRKIFSGFENLKALKFGARALPLALAAELLRLLRCGTTTPCTTSEGSSL